ncbi:hypothetical protein KDM41_17470 [bacterium]|nr:hypothetical protein [bacterium]
MGEDRYRDDTLGNGRGWGALTADGAPLEWSVDPAKGSIQGPLDLEFLRDKRMTLFLEEGQQALLIQEGRLRAVYLDGLHHLEIGEGRGQIHPASRLLFLAMDEPLQLRWSRANPLRWSRTDGGTLIGSCALRIARPCDFFDTFLLGVETPDPGFVGRLLDQTVRGLFEELLRAMSGDGLDAGALQARLTRLTPADLNEDLADFGLACTHLAVYTAQPPAEEIAEAPVVQVSERQH